MLRKCLRFSRVYFFISYKNAFFISDSWCMKQVSYIEWYHDYAAFNINLSVILYPHYNMCCLKALIGHANKIVFLSVP